MFDAIFTGTSGLQASAAALQLIGHNVANLNTPGFKSTEARFADLFQPGAQGGTPTTVGGQGFGAGVVLGPSFLDLQPGPTRQTGQPLDLAIEGDGHFMLREREGAPTRYTRAGAFEFDAAGTLVERGSGQAVLGLAPGGATAPISLNGLRLQAPRATASVKLSGNVSSGADEVTLDGVVLIDAAGAQRTLKLVLRPDAEAAARWRVSAVDGETEVGGGSIAFTDGRIVAGADVVTVAGVRLDFGGDTTSFDTGSTSSLALASSDGLVAGALTRASFDADGTLQLAYSNGGTAQGPRLALAVFDDPGVLQPDGGSALSASSEHGLHLGAPGDGRFGRIASSQLEGSNVDLSSEFSDLIVTQRGYQAASRIVSTASEMLQELFDLKGRR